MPNQTTENIPILVVDDEESLRHTFKIFLKREGYGPIVLASNFEEAVYELANNSFELIIRDIVLGGNTGIDLSVGSMSMPCLQLTGFMITGGDANLCDPPKY